MESDSVAALNKSIEKDIRDYGWTCLHVFPTDDSHIQFSYSIGFAKSFSAAEVLVFGLAWEKAHSLLYACAEILKAGGSIPVDVEDDRVLQGGYKVIFKAVKPEAFGEYLGTACRFYANHVFRAVVMFLPDAQHRYPWQADYAYIDAREAQSNIYL